MRFLISWASQIACRPRCFWDRFLKWSFHLHQSLIPFQERTQAGLKAARAHGKMSGRASLLDTRQINRMLEMYDEQRNTAAEICKIYSISRPSFYNYLNNRQKELAKNAD